ncbi:hypothetical protein, partial [Streptomyces sp. NPDC059491]|uniref:hypothetical protein n=1 Tax=Streptomyces sp. NPDC059491 TaxID=3346850 RepID=UPI00369F3F34
AVPSDTQQRAKHDPSVHPHVPRRSSTGEVILVIVPTNQRSTHELTVQNVCLQSVLCSLERR